MSGFDHLEGLDELRTACPQGSVLHGPEGEGGATVTVNGRLAAACMKDGVREGPSLTWYPDGTRETSGSYHAGEREGEWTYWHENGQVSGRGRFEAGTPIGKWVTWYDDGQPESVGEYRDGKRNGLFTQWSRDGRAEAIEYLDGEVVRRLPPDEGPTEG